MFGTKTITGTERDSAQYMRGFSEGQIDGYEKGGKLARQDFEEFYKTLAQDREALEKEKREFEEYRYRELFKMLREVFTPCATAGTKPWQR